MESLPPIGDVEPGVWGLDGRCRSGWRMARSRRSAVTARLRGSTAPRHHRCALCRPQHLTSQVSVCWSAFKEVAQSHTVRGKHKQAECDVLMSRDKFLSVRSRRIERFSANGNSLTQSTSDLAPFVPPTSQERLDMWLGDMVKILTKMYIL